MITQQKTADYYILSVGYDVTTLSDGISLSKKIDSLIQQQNFFLALQFSETASISPSFLGFLAQRLQQLKEHHGRLVIISNNLDFRTLLRITDMEKIIPIYSNIDAFYSSLMTKTDTPEPNVTRCPLCHKPGKIFDEKMKRIVRKISDNNRYCCFHCKISWRKKNPEKIAKLRSKNTY
ncbi:MAG: hypothetical protein A2293_05840 [Elusimicrobia bacterium RIFOXYB2_FULL_49_7]|nr:MAG: hypothetical protein A2293_05840 [Elusimicrobia bacterium RIFOXYB2_FULL_49_7]